MRHPAPIISQVDIVVAAGCITLFTSAKLALQSLRGAFGDSRPARIE